MLPVRALPNDCVPNEKWLYRNSFVTTGANARSKVVLEQWRSAVQKRTSCAITASCVQHHLAQRTILWVKNFQSK
jgi:hypothetical protein